MSNTISINKKNKIKILDQRQLPFKEKYIITDNYKVVIAAIKNLSVRGAPAIGVAGAFASFLALNELKDKQNFILEIRRRLKQINDSGTNPILRFIKDNINIDIQAACLIGPIPTTIM